VSRPVVYESVLLPEAEADITDAVRWYEAQKRGLGRSFLDQLRSALDKVAHGPSRYQRVFGPARRVLLRQFPYAVFYEVFALTIVVLACMHTARDPEDWQRRVLR
jgi:toxin ParE1/3/4